MALFNFSRASAVTILLSVFVSMTADAIPADPLISSYTAFIQEQRQLELKRLEINKKQLEWFDKSYDKLETKKELYAFGLTSRPSLEAERAEYHIRIVKLDARLKFIKREHERAASIIEAELQKQNRVELIQQAKSCGRELVSLRSAENNAFLKTYASILSGIEGSSNPNSLQILTLVRSSFYCQRRIADWTDTRAMKAKPLAACFNKKVLEFETQRGGFLIDAGAGGDKWTGWNYVWSATSATMNNLTGHEEALKSFVIKQPEYRTKPWDVFGEAIRLAKGNLRKALKLAYGTLRLNRTNMKFQRHLLDIRGDRRHGGDNSGDWYHFFGTMLMKDIYRSGMGPMSSAFRVVWLPEGEGSDFGDKKEMHADKVGSETQKHLLNLLAERKEIHRADACTFTRVFERHD